MVSGKGCWKGSVSTKTRDKGSGSVKGLTVEGDMKVGGELDHGGKVEMEVVIGKRKQEVAIRKVKSSDKFEVGMMKWNSKYEDKWNVGVGN